MTAENDAARRKPSSVVGFDPAVSVEDPTQRTEYATVFKNPDGSNTARVSPLPVHYQDSRGAWQRIDSRVVADVANPGGFRSGANAWSARFGTSKKGVSFESPDGSMSMSLVGGRDVQPAPATDGTSVVYADVFPNVDLKYTVTPVGIKESVVLKAAAAVPLFVFAVDGVNIEADATSGGFRPIGKLGQRFHLDPLVVETATGEQVTSKAAGSMAITPGSPRPGLPGALLAVGISPAWLRTAPASSFPVVIDPSLSISRLNQSAFGRGGATCTTNPNCPAAWVGNSTFDTYRSVTTFDYSGLLPSSSQSSILTAATFTASYSSGDANDRLIALRRATDFSFWGVCNTPVPNCTDYSTMLDVGAQTIGTTSVSWNVWSYLNTNWWYAGAPMVGWALSGEEPATYTYKAVLTSLTLTYNRLPVIAQSAMVPANGTVKHAPDGLNLSILALTDPDGEQLLYDFQMSSDPGFVTLVRDSGWLTTNNYNAWPVFGGSIPASYYNQQLYWRVVLSNAGSAGVTYGPINQWKLQNLAAPAPTLVSPGAAGGVFRWSPNVPLTLVANATTDPDGPALYPGDVSTQDPVYYRFVVREAGSTGALIRSLWSNDTGSGITIGGTVSWTVPADSRLQPGGVYEWGVEIRDEVTRFNYYLYLGNAQVAPAVTRSARFEQRLGASGPSPFQSTGPITANLANGNVSTAVSTPSFSTVGGAMGATFVYNSRQPDVGLKARYYNDAVPLGSLDANDKLIVERTDKTVNFDWGSGAPAPGVQADLFWVTWNGYLTVPTSGPYQILRSYSGSSQLVIGATTVWNYATLNMPVNGQEGPGNAFIVNLTANTPTPISLTYWDDAGTAHVGLYAISPANSTTAGTGPVVSLPESWLTASEPVLGRGWTMNHASEEGAAYIRATVQASEIQLTRTDGDVIGYTKNDANGSWQPPAGEDDVVTTKVDPVSGGTLVTVTSTDGMVHQFKTDGQLDTITPPADSNAPAAPTSAWTAFAGDGGRAEVRLTAKTDPVSGKQLQFMYAGVNGVPLVTGAAPTSCPAATGFASTLRLGLLCRVRFPDASSTDLYYTQDPNSVYYLSRVTNPGAAITDFGYSFGILSAVRTPLVNDYFAAGLMTTAQLASGDFNYLIAYDNNTGGYFNDRRVTSVTAPKPTLAATLRAGFSIAYTSQTESRVMIAGLDNTALTTDFDRQVFFDEAARWTENRQAANADASQVMISKQTWNASDQVLDSTAYGRWTTNFYSSEGWLTDTYGPADLTCFDTTTASPTYRRPKAGAGACAPTVPHTATAYDQGLSGPSVNYWSNTELAGPPTKTTTESSWDATGNGAIWQNWSTAGVPGTNQFSARLTGSLVVNSTNTYTFQLSKVDRARLWIDDKIAIDSWLDATPAGTATTANSAAMSVTAGTHRIRIDYAHTSAATTAFVRLYWSVGGGCFALTPNSVCSGGNYITPVGKITPRYGLATSVTSDDTGGAAPSTVTTTAYGTPGGTIDPAMGMQTTVASGGLTTQTGYETGAGTFRRRISRTMPSGSQYTYAYYGNTVGTTADVACTPANDTTVNQAGLLRLTTAPDPDGAGALTSRTEESVYDVMGRTVASRTSGGAWTCTAYDTRGRPTSKTVPNNGSVGGRTVIYNYAVSANPLVSSVADGYVAGSTNGSTITTTVDLTGKTVSYTDVWGQTTTTTYDQADRVTDTASALGAVHTDLDRAGRVTATKLNGVTLATPTYTAGTAGGELDTATYSNGTSMASIVRNLNGQTTGLTFKKGTANVTASTVVRSQSGRITSATADGWTDTYTYDNAGRLCTAQLSTVKTINYRYGGTTNCQIATTGPGANGNRTSVDETTSGAGGAALTRSTVGAWSDLFTTTTGFTTGSFTPPANSLLVMAVAYENNGGNSLAPAITLTNTGGLTFTKRAERLETALFAQAVAIFTAPVGAAPTAMTVTTTNGGIGTSGWRARADAYTGYDTVTPVGATGTASALNNAGLGFTMALSGTTAATSETYAALGGDEAAASASPVSPGAGWTEQYESGTKTPNLQVETKTGATSTATWTTIGAAATTKAVTAAVEIRQAAGGGGVTTTTTFSYDLADRLTAMTGQSAPTYDGGGNTLTVAGQTFGWDGADRNLSVAAGATAVTYQRDATDRIVSRIEAGIATRYAHTGDGDTADVTLDATNIVTERVLALVGGVTLTMRGVNDVWSYRSLRGDVVATATSGGMTSGGPFRFDPFGRPLTSSGAIDNQAVPDNRREAFDAGWLGQHLRLYEHAGALSIVQMGQRPYVPQLGRFASVDPIEGGCSNDYAYVADPINKVDLDGTRSCDKVNSKGAHAQFRIKATGKVGRIGGKKATGRGYNFIWDWYTGNSASFAIMTITITSASGRTRTTTISGPHHPYPSGFKGLHGVVYLQRGDKVSVTGTVFWDPPLRQEGTFFDVVTSKTDLKSSCSVPA